MRAVSDLELEQFLCDDLEEADRLRVAAAIDADDVLTAHVAARREAQADFRRRRPALRPVSSTSLTVVPPALGWWARMRAAVASVAVPAAAAAACALLFVVVDDVGTSTVIRARGHESAQLVVKRDGRIFRHTDQPLRAGDAVRIRLAQRTEDAGHRAMLVSIVSVDVHGSVDVLLNGVGVDDDGYLQGSLLLDDSEGEERWVVVGAREAVEVGRLVSVARMVAHSTDGEAVDVGVLEKSLGAVTLSVLSFEKEPATP